ncbi:MAG: RNB domain-containing ribonuclease, partial [Clostridiales bacterium]|nr:RNB domain-containing ribonuclease [Clostridiales bacterium]
LLGDAHLPVLYRVPEQPDAQRMQELAIFLNNLGYRPRGLRGEVKPRALRAVLDAAHGTKHEAIVSRVLLRSLKKARYSDDNYSHFRLASTDYCHFTSPIRRCPDLMIHRQVAMLLDADTEPITVSDMYLDTCVSAAAQASTCERRALEAERAVEALKMAEYMHAHIGEEFDGVISGVTDFGLFVELPNLVEGLVRMSDLHDDYYIHDKKSYALYGRSSGRRYALGDSIRILVQAVDVPARQISFGLAGRAQ